MAVGSGSSSPLTWIFPPHQAGPPGGGGGGDEGRRELVADHLALRQVALGYRLPVASHSIFRPTWPDSYFTNSYKLHLNLSTRESAFIERFKQESMYGLSAKKVAVVERLPLSGGGR